jgi:hypothetical protein
MGALYGHAWTSSYGDNPRNVNGSEWASTLAGFSRSDIDRGLDACRAEGAEFPPSAPRFRAMCLGIPSLARVKLELTREGVERSPFACLVWSHIDSYAYRNAAQRDAERMIREAYELAREDRMLGAPLPQVVASLQQDKPEFVPATPEQKAAHLERIRQELGLSKPEADLIGEEGLIAAGGVVR